MSLGSDLSTLRFDKFMLCFNYNLRDCRAKGQDLRYSGQACCDASVRDAPTRTAGAARFLIFLKLSLHSFNAILLYVLRRFTNFITVSS